jgi:5-methylcytosine-specific restriction protein A
MVYEAHHIERAPDRTGTERDAIVFELRALEAIAEVIEAAGPPPGIELKELHQRALAAAEVSSQTSTQGTRNVYQRSRDVRNYVLARANGKCEGCNAPAPFLRTDGTPYLEPHHLRRVSDGGPDHPAHVIALCPNCHRRVHAGADGHTYNISLIAMMPTIEA